MQDVLIEHLLGDEGFRGPVATARAREVLELAGLTRPGKRRLAFNKVERAKSLLHERLAPTCGSEACRMRVGDREVVEVPSASCEVCGGSRNEQAGYLARQRLLGAGVQRVLVVGGSRTTLADLRESLAGDGLEVRSVNGTDGPRKVATVEADLAWAQVLVVWASTPLPHKVSEPYTNRARGTMPMLTVARRGVEAVCQALLRMDSPTDGRDA